jgi:NTP pyrophosphatase (non-canonical NTP hydrolase)
MEFDEYQELARRTALYPIIGAPCIYPALGLAGEAGEVAEQIKKIFRDDGGYVTKDRLDKLVKELGDVLWYVANLAHELNLPLDYIARLNIEKLQKRKNEDNIHGDGSDR